MEAQRHRMEERRLDIVINGGTEAYIVWWTLRMEAQRHRIEERRLDTT